MQPNLSVTIETLMLVAVWEPPFVFQGYFNISEAIQVRTYSTTSNNLHGIPSSALRPSSPRTRREGNNEGSYLDKTSHRQILFFRCEYSSSVHTSVIHPDFSPYDYQFTDLCNETKTIQLDALETRHEHAIYLLKYALHATLLLMLKNNKQHLVAADEIAMKLIVERIKPLFSQESLTIDNPEIGFAVSMDFNPEEQTGRDAVSALLGKNNLPPANYSIQ